MISTTELTIDNQYKCHICRNITKIKRISNNLLKECPICFSKIDNVWITNCNHVFACSNCFTIYYGINILNDYMDNYENNLTDTDFKILFKSQEKILRKAYYLVSCFRCGVRITYGNVKSDINFIGLYKHIICDNLNCRKNNKSDKVYFSNFQKTNILFDNILNHHICYKTRTRYFFDSYTEYYILKEKIINELKYY